MQYCSALCIYHSPVGHRRSMLIMVLGLYSYLVYCLQRRIWLCKPMRDPQTLPQMLHLWVLLLSGLLVRSVAFLRARFSIAALVRFSSPVFSCCFRELLHLGRSAARASQLSGSICRAFMSLLQTSQLWSSSGSLSGC